MSSVRPRRSAAAPKRFSPPLSNSSISTEPKTPVIKLETPPAPTKTQKRKSAEIKQEVIEAEEFQLPDFIFQRINEAKRIKVEPVPDIEKKPKRKCKFKLF
jgi:hypothetical protein